MSYSILRDEVGPVFSLPGLAGPGARMVPGKPVARFWTAASVGVRLVRGMLRLVGSRWILLALFIGHVMADDTAADRAYDGVMAGVMACHAADQRSLQTPFRFG